MSSVFHELLRNLSDILELPVVIMLIAFLAISLFSLGWLLTERLTERRYLRRELRELISHPEDCAERITGSCLPRRQKQLLQELCSHSSFSPALRQELAANLLEREESHYAHIMKITELVSKLAPMFGLLGTLIPLGPGIIALGQGDTYTLSVRLLTAFDTTVAGLIAAAVCLVITAIRKRWYSADMADLELLMAILCEKEAAKCEE